MDAALSPTLSAALSITLSLSVFDITHKTLYGHNAKHCADHNQKTKKSMHMTQRWLVLFGTYAGVIKQQHNVTWRFPDREGNPYIELVGCCLQRPSFCSPARSAKTVWPPTGRPSRWATSSCGTLSTHNHSPSRTPPLGGCRQGRPVSPFGDRQGDRAAHARPPEIERLDIQI